MVEIAWIASIRIRSSGPTNSFHSIGIAATKATKGSRTAAMLMFRCALVILSRGYVPEEPPVTPFGHDQDCGSCRFSTNGHLASVGGAATGGGRRAASRAA